jgi:hypothetical protein
LKNLIFLNFDTSGFQNYVKHIDEMYKDRLVGIAASNLFSKNLPFDNESILDNVNLYIENDPFSSLFFPGTEIGETIEQLLVHSFGNLENKIEKTSEYDLLCSCGLKIEVKVARAFEGTNGQNTSFFDRSFRKKELSTKNGDGLKKISNPKFQQIKPKHFDFLIGLVVFSDHIDLYLFKNTDFVFDSKQANKVKLSLQHAGNVGEGQTTSLKSIENFKVAQIDKNLSFDFIN